MFVNLFSADYPTSEVAPTIDISFHGARVVTKTFWRPNQQISVRSIRGRFYSRARVVHCERYSGDSFVVGLEISNPEGDWTTAGNPYLDAKKVLQEIVERYEEMFAQYQAIRTVFAQQAKTDVSLLAEYAEVLLATDFQGEVHARFLPLYAAIAELSEATDIPSLLSQIPLIPKAS
jgi:hypothetical protein